METVGQVSPSEDMGSFTKQIARMAQSLGIDAQQSIPRIEDSVFDYVFSESSIPVAIQYIPTLLQAVKQTWATPSIVVPMSKRLELMYKVQQKDAEYLFAHPKPNSIIVESTQWCLKNPRLTCRQGRSALGSAGALVILCSSFGLEGPELSSPNVLSIVPLE